MVQNQKAYMAYIYAFHGHYKYTRGRCHEFKLLSKSAMRSLQSEYGYLL